MFETSNDYKRLFKDFVFLAKKIKPDANKKLMMRSSSREEGEAVWDEIDKEDESMSKIALYRNLVGSHINAIMQERDEEKKYDSHIGH